MPVRAESSVAADPKYIPLGAPVFLSMDNPRASGLWIAQDTGGSIKGANRFDTFWGAGEDARVTAGGMSARGQAVLLLPKGTLHRLGVRLMRSPRGLSPEEKALWQRVAKTVVSLKSSPEEGDRWEALCGRGDPPTCPSPESPAKRATAAAPRSSAVTPPAPGRILDRHGLDSSWERKLKGARIDPDFTLDLHGYTLDAAHSRLDGGLIQAKAMGARLVLVVTGKPRPVDAADRGTKRGAIRAKILDWLAAGPHGADIAAIRGRPSPPRRRGRALHRAEGWGAPPGRGGGGGGGGWGASGWVYARRGVLKTRPPVRRQSFGPHRACRYVVPAVRWRDPVLEYTGEAEYRIDRMMSQLALSGILGRVAGVAFGQCTRCSIGVPGLNRLHGPPDPAPLPRAARRARIPRRQYRPCREPVGGAAVGRGRDRRGGRVDPDPGTRGCLNQPVRPNGLAHRHIADDVVEGR